MKPLTSKQLMWVGIDLDETLAHNSGLPNFELAEPVEGAKEALEKIVDMGFKPIIYTARPYSDYNIIENWLDINKIPFRRIICGKVLLRWMIDDKAINFSGNWGEVLAKIK
jgi:hypothetical protein